MALTMLMFVLLCRAWFDFTGFEVYGVFPFWVRFRFPIWSAYVLYDYLFALIPDVIVLISILMLTRHKVPPSPNNSAWY